jgi:hypothetical protein
MRAKGNNIRPFSFLPALLFYYMRLDVFSWHAAVIILPYSIYIQGLSTKPMKRIIQQPENQYAGQNFD